jgi:hypothetical protein
MTSGNRKTWWEQYEYPWGVILKACYLWSTFRINPPEVKTWVMRTWGRHSTAPWSKYFFLHACSDQSACFCICRSRNGKGAAFQKFNGDTFMSTGARTRLDHWTTWTWSRLHQRAPLTKTLGPWADWPAQTCITSRASWDAKSLRKQGPQSRRHFDRG